MPESITLPCAFESGDELEVEVSHDGFGSPTVLFRPTTGDASGVTHLDKESARALFNWLGVWLHTQ